jgi:hypothetical protein
MARDAAARSEMAEPEPKRVQGGCRLLIEELVE